MDRGQDIIRRLEKALRFYADPATYHTIEFVPGKVCGAFMDDLSEDHGDDDFYRLRMPGATARRALKELAGQSVQNEHEDDELRFEIFW